MAKLDFNVLYNQYNSGNLVPVIGQEVLKIIMPDERRLTLEEYIIEKVTGRKYEDGISPRNLSELALLYTDLNSNDVIGIYNSIRPKQFDTTILDFLTNKIEFRFYLMTCYDRKLEELLGHSCDYKIWHHEIQSPLFFDMQNDLRKIVYLFGRIKDEFDDDDRLSFTDEDKMESLYSLSIQNTAFEKENKRTEYPLFKLLANKTLLFIGNNFQDWFMKFTIRTLSTTPYSRNNKNKAYIINDSRKKIEYENYFFDKYNIQIIHDFPIDNFVKNFWYTIQENENDTKTTYTNKNVFISYDREADKQYAESICHEIRKRGINIWLDTRELKIGEFDIEIRKQIENTPLFISVVSSSLINKDDAKSYVKSVEWQIAADMYKADEIWRRKGQKQEGMIVLPIAIDDCSDYISRLPEFLRKANIYSYNDENLFDDIENLIKEKHVIKESV